MLLGWQNEADEKNCQKYERKVDQENVVTIAPPLPPRALCTIPGIGSDHM